MSFTNPAWKQRKADDMLTTALGIAAFALYFLYDINSFLWQRRIPRLFFMTGTLFLGGATVLDLLTALRSGCFSGFWDILLLSVGALFFAALIYALFFALPFKETYADQQTGNHVYDRGVYALCRHPGILFFFGMYLCTGLAALPGPMLIHNLVFSLLNTGYAWFQDRITFPKTFCDYADYQKRIPFLIPTPASIRAAFYTMSHENDEEDDS